VVFDGNGFPTAFLTGMLLTADFLAGAAFFAGAFLAGAFFATFLTAAFLAGAFFAAFFTGAFFCSLLGYRFFNRLLRHVANLMPKGAPIPIAPRAIFHISMSYT
jgi:hypothetical protein